MRVLSSVYGGRGDVEPHIALALELRKLGVETRLCAPADCAARLAEVGLTHIPVGQRVRPLVQGATRPTPADVPRIAAAVMAAQFEDLAPAAEGCDVLVSSGLLPAAAAAHSVADALGIVYVSAAYCPIYLPSPHHPPRPLPGRPLPPDVTDNRALWALSATHANDLFGGALNAQRAAIGLLPVEDVYTYVTTDHPLLAADPVLGPWPGAPELDVTQTGAWITPDERPLPSALTTFLDAGTAPVYVGFGSMPAPSDIARLAIDALRARGWSVLVSRGWAELNVLDEGDDCLLIGDVAHQALFPRVAAVIHHGGAGTTTAAARAGAPQVVLPQMADQPYWASRVAELGIGAAHAGPVPTAESFAAALDVALSEAVRDRAVAVAATIRGDGARIAAERLVGLIGGR